MATVTKAQRIAAVNAMDDSNLKAMLTGMGVSLEGTETTDELKAKAIEKSIGGINFNFSSPWFNLLAAVIALVMAGIPSTQLWGALLIVVVVIADVVRTLRRMKAAGKGWKDWQEALKELQMELWAAGIAVLAVFATDMIFLLVSAGMLITDSVTEVKKS